jgi:hypothetical protein
VENHLQKTNRPQEMEDLVDLDFGSIEYGPVRLVWGYSRITDPKVVVSTLREALPCNTQMFGFCTPELDFRDGYIYEMVLWPSALPDNSTETELLTTQWREALREMVAELDALSLQSGSGYCLSRWQVDFRPSWDNGVVDFVKEFIEDAQLHEASYPEDEMVFFGTLRFEYEVDEKKWRETHYVTAESGYVAVVELVDGEDPVTA